jgi:chromosome segregation protein
MPKLKQLQIHGFKSFADSLTLVFPTGITAIVGPNGSGKSNISDAIRWVLGEQRISNLRGRVGEDMIFTGSKKRARAGMSRVILTFDNSEQWLPLDFAEVTTARQTYRDGKTDYLLNGSKVRLMDLRDVLDRAGLGRDAYLFIGQGSVDQVLSLRPSERMAIFEQASGIAPYRNRRENAAEKLEETRHNLERVRDIIGEIEPRLRRLKRQAERAEQHQRLTVELKDALTTWYGYRWGHALTDLDLAYQRVGYRENLAFRHLAAVETLEMDIRDLRRQITERRVRLAELHRQESQRHSEAEALQRDLAVMLERQRSYKDRQEEIQTNLIPLNTALEAGEHDIGDLERDLATQEIRLENARAALAEAERAHQAILQQRQTLLRSQRRIQAQVLAHRQRIADRQSRLDQLTERSAQLAQRIKELEASLATVTQRRQEGQSAVEQARHTLEEAEIACEALEKSEAQLREAHTRSREAIARLRNELNTQQMERQKLETRLDALERLRTEGVGLYAGVRAVLQAAEASQLDGILGTVANLLRVPPELDRAIEVAMGSRMQNIITERWSSAQDAVAWLKRQRAGRATFLPLDTLRPGKPLDLPPSKGVVGLALDLVSFDPRIRPAAALLLGKTAVAEDLSAARALHSKLRGGFQIVTLEGEIVRSSGSVTGGSERKQQGSGLLARARERREIPKAIQHLTQKIDVLEKERREAEQKAQHIDQKLRTLNEKRREAQHQRQQSATHLDRTVSALEQSKQEVKWQQRLLQESKLERESTKTTCARLTQELEEAAQALTDAEAKLETLEKELAGLDGENDNTPTRAAQTHATVSECRTKVALLEQEYKDCQILLATRRREVQRMTKQVQAQTQRLETLAENLATLEGELGDLQDQYKDAGAAVDALAKQIPPLENEVGTLEAHLREREASESEARRSLREAEQHLSQAEMEASRHEDQVQALRHEIEETLNIVVRDLPENLAMQEPLPLKAIASSLPKVDVLPEALEQQIRDLRTQIRRLEPVYAEAKKEYEEVSERHRFLSEQMDDLETASAHLRKIIVELDEMMDQMFRITFKAIASEFSRIFKMLFEGGTAKLVLQSEEDEGARGEITGVEIMARPPGKRTSALSMLSGGERSLTAVALLFATLLISPTPFCVLDEVDAMLDEANVGRFRALLRELSRETQFIIITHNRGTVEAADTIYGVSMGDDGVSQVLSLSLEDLPPSEVI